MSDEVYRERARLVAFIASLFPSVRAYSDSREPEWSVVYVDTPAGQLSWHIAESDVDLFAHVPLVAPDDLRAQWDGHTTEEKYERLAELITERQPTSQIHINVTPPRLQESSAIDYFRRYGGGFGPGMRA